MFHFYSASLSNTPGDNSVPGDKPHLLACAFAKHNSVANDWDMDIPYIGSVVQLHRQRKPDSILQQGTYDCFEPGHFSLSNV